MIHRMVQWVALALVAAIGCNKAKAPEPPKTPFGPPPTLRATLKGHRGIVNAVAFGGEWLASGGQDQTVKLWDPASGKELHSLKVESRGGPTTPATIWSLAFSGDGKVLVAGCEDATVVWEVVSEQGKPALKQKAVLPAKARGQSVAISRDGKLVAWISDQATVSLWDVAAEKEKAAFKHAEPAWTVRALALSGDGARLATGCADRQSVVGLLHFWDVATKEGKPGNNPHTGDVRALAIDREGTLVASVAKNGIKLSDATTGKMKDETLRDGDRPLGGDAVAFGGDGRLLALANHFGSAIHLWDLTANRPRANLQGEGAFLPMGVALTDDARLLAVAARATQEGNSEPVIYLWEIPTAEPPGEKGK